MSRPLLAFAVRKVTSDVPTLPDHVVNFRATLSNYFYLKKHLQNHFYGTVQVNGVSVSASPPTYCLFLHYAMSDFKFHCFL